RAGGRGRGGVAARRTGGAGGGRARRPLRAPSPDGAGGRAADAAAPRRDGARRAGLSRLVAVGAVASGVQPRAPGGGGSGAWGGGGGWGGRVGSLVYWSPGVEVLDRGLLEVGDRVVFGAGVRLASHVLVPGKDGRARIVIAPIRIGRGALVGAYSVLTPGVEV